VSSRWAATLSGASLTPNCRCSSIGDSSVLKRYPAIVCVSRTGSMCEVRGANNQIVHKLLAPFASFSASRCLDCASVCGTGQWASAGNCFNPISGVPAYPSSLGDRSRGSRTTRGGTRRTRRRIDSDIFVIYSGQPGCLAVATLCDRLLGDAIVLCVWKGSKVAARPPFFW
jgi:hypothetical protein